MKKLSILFLILCLTLTAGTINKTHYLIFLFRTTMTVHDRQLCLQKIKNQLKDKSEVNPANLGKWYWTANTNVIFRAICIDVQRKNIPWTRAQVVAWKDANLDNPARLQIVYGEGQNGANVLKANDVLPVIEPEPAP